MTADDIYLHLVENMNKIYSTHPHQLIKMGLEKISGNDNGNNILLQDTKPQSPPNGTIWYNTSYQDVPEKKLYINGRWMLVSKGVRVPDYNGSGYINSGWANGTKLITTQDHNLYGLRIKFTKLTFSSVLNGGGEFYIRYGDPSGESLWHIEIRRYDGDGGEYAKVRGQLNGSYNHTYHEKPYERLSNPSIIAEFKNNAAASGPDVQGEGTFEDVRSYEVKQAYPGKEYTGIEEANVKNKKLYLDFNGSIFEPEWEVEIEAIDHGETVPTEYIQYNNLVRDHKDF